MIEVNLPSSSTRTDSFNGDAYSDSYLFIIVVRLPRFLYLVAPAISSFLAASNPSPPSSSSRGRTTRNGAEGLLDRRYSGGLAATLDKLCMWEKKLYEEVKAEERLRIRYEKQCKKLKWLDERGADTGKVEAMQASIRKLLTKIDVSIKTVEAISTRIRKLREDELQPQITDLVLGLRRMWSSMLKSHQRQFQAILESKTQTLKANTGLRQHSSVRVTLALEMQLLKWSSRFNQWIDTQRSYAESLNGWLSRCLLHQPEETPDGIVPFSPGRIGAPPVFVICHDWNQVIDRISESAVQTAMHDFATSLHQLWERQDDEQRQRVKADHAFIDYEKQIQSLREEKGRNHTHGHDSKPDRVSLSMVHFENGVSPLDDLKVDLDTLKQKVRDQRAGHKEAVKLVHDAVSRSIQAGLIPIFEALESFTLEAAKAYENIRVQFPSGCKSSKT
ncbi:ALTERED PHOSPHATE STARVATION RESPONSE 1-like protein [Drosera capensis]